MNKDGSIDIETLKKIDKACNDSLSHIVLFRPACVTCKNMVDEQGKAVCDVDGCDKPLRDFDVHDIDPKEMENEDG